MRLKPAHLEPVSTTVPAVKTGGHSVAAAFVIPFDVRSTPRSAETLSPLLPTNT